MQINVSYDLSKYSIGRFDNAETEHEIAMAEGKGTGAESSWSASIGTIGLHETRKYL